MSKPPLILSCPTCKKSILYSAQNSWRPFCSERCKLIDLGEWASEGHRIPSAPLDKNPQDGSEDES